MARFSRFLTGATISAASLVGIVAFLYPFSAARQVDALSANAHAQDAPFLFVILIVLCLGAVLADMAATPGSAKRVAVLGVLAATAAVLRTVHFVGFSAIFFLPILGGYVFGASFGFLLGALSLLVSALLGGIGPWLPFQMFATGWVGLLSGLLPRGRLRGTRRLEPTVLALWGLGLGLVFGAVMNLWFWPFVIAPGQSSLYWEAGISLGEAIRRYAAFYTVTSLPHDVWRAGGNFLMLLLFGRPILRLLDRFHRRFQFEVETIRDPLPSASPPLAPDGPSLSTKGSRLTV